MQRPTPRTPDQPAPNPVGIDPRLTVELTSVLAGARRRAHRDGDPQIDTAHLLHSLLESDPGVRAVLAADAQVARVLGYLVQRSIGYGLRWRGSVENSGAAPMVCPATGQGWSPSALAAMVRALRIADLRGEPRAGGVDLLEAIASDSDCRAVDVLERAGVDLRLLAARLTGDPRQVS